MKVLHVIDSGGLYGAEMMLINLVENQVKLGVDPLILSYGDIGVAEKKLETEASARGLPIKPVRVRAGLNLLAGLSLIRYAKREGVDVIHSHGYKFNIILGMLPKAVRKISLITTLHGYVDAKRYSKMWLYEVLDRVFIKRANLVVLVNRHMLKNKTIQAMNLKNYSIINNGVDNVAINCTKLAPEFELFVSQHRYTIGFVGRLSPEKGLSVLLHSLSNARKQNYDLGLVVIGAGTQQADLMNTVRELGIQDNVLFMGYISKPTVYMPHLNALIMPSFTEGLPITLLEAMSASVPIVASNVGGIPDVLGRDECGSLVEPKNSEALTGAIIELIKNPEETYRKVDNALSKVRTHYSAKLMAERYVELYLHHK